MVSGLTMYKQNYLCFQSARRNIGMRQFVRHKSTRQSSRTHNIQNVKTRTQQKPMDPRCKNYKLASICGPTWTLEVKIKEFQDSLPYVILGLTTFWCAWVFISFVTPFLSKNVYLRALYSFPAFPIFAFISLSIFFETLWFCLSNCSVILILVLPCWIFYKIGQVTSFCK